MSIKLQTLLVNVALLIHIVATAAAGPSCQDSLTSIYQAELGLAQSLLRKEDLPTALASLSPREYILCPNTVYPISEAAEEMPLLVILPHLHLLCGAHGRSQENCIFQGGRHQVLAPPRDVGTDVLPASFPLDASGFQLRGVTLRGATDIVVGLVGRGRNILFHDVVLEDSTGGTFGIYVEGSSSSSSRTRQRALLLSSSSWHSLPSRRQQEEEEEGTISVPSDDEPVPLGVTFRQCQFENNEKEISLLGSIGTARVVVEESTFDGNTIPPRPDHTGSLLWFTGGAGSVTSNCFTHNNSYALSAVLVNGGDFDIFGNFLQPPPSTSPITTTTCPHVYQVPPNLTLGESLERESYTCVDFAGTSDACRDRFSSGAVPTSIPWWMETMLGWVGGTLLLCCY